MKPRGSPDDYMHVYICVFTWWKFSNSQTELLGSRILKFLQILNFSDSSKGLLGSPIRADCSVIKKKIKLNQPAAHCIV